LGVVSGIAQGVFEWLPVSSKTILLMMFYWLGASPAQAYVIGLFLNGSTAAAAALYFRKDLIEAIKELGEPGSHGRRLLVFLTASTLVTGTIAVPLAYLTTEIFTALRKLSMILIGVMFCALTAILWIEERLGKRDAAVRSLRLRDGILAGLAQGFSALPGMSRSGLTIFALLALGYKPPEAIKLSFLMSVPATIGGSIYAYALCREALAPLTAATLIASTAAALTTSILTIAALLKISQKIKPHLFTLTLAAIALATTIPQP